MFDVSSTGNTVLLVESSDCEFLKTSTSSLVALTSMQLVVLSTVSMTAFVASSIEASET